ncbi:hypothetical protein GM716_10060, partial [Vibrio cholerae]|nr:hypothetical protein [Vibrio cholerae]
GVWIDLDKIKVPSYFISTKEDHIALWQGTYRGALRTGRELDLWSFGFCG